MQQALCCRGCWLAMRMQQLRNRSAVAFDSKEAPPEGCLSPPGTISALAPRLLLWLSR